MHSYFLESFHIIMQDKGTDYMEEDSLWIKWTLKKQCNAGSGRSGGNVRHYRAAARRSGGAAGADGLIGCGSEYRYYCDLYDILLYRRVFDRQKKETQEIFVGTVRRRVLFCSAATWESGCKPGTEWTAGADADDGRAVYFVRDGGRDA